MHAATLGICKEDFLNHNVFKCNSVVWSAAGANDRFLPAYMTSKVLCALQAQRMDTTTWPKHGASLLTQLELNLGDPTHPGVSWVVM